MGNVWKDVSQTEEQRGLTEEAATASQQLRARVKTGVALKPKATLLSVGGSLTPGWDWSSLFQGFTKRTREGIRDMISPEFFYLEAERMDDGAGALSYNHPHPSFAEVASTLPMSLALCLHFKS